jgi:ATP adenylyltransferase
MEYVSSVHGPESGRCVFCDLVDGDDGTRILALEDLAFVTLAEYPYNPGHLLVLPRRHTGEFEDVTAEEHAAMTALVQRSLAALREEMAPHGFNLGMNLGRIAGAGIPEHLHWHVVPRWNGDSNAMTVIGETRVLPELLEQTFARLRPRFDP